MPPGMVPYNILVLCYSQLMILNAIGDRICRDLFMTEMWKVLCQVQLAQERHEVHGDMVFKQLTNTFVGCWFRVWSIHQGPRENEWTQASKNTLGDFHRPVKRRKDKGEGVVHADYLRIEDVERWKGIQVKQGERPTDGPTTEVIRGYLRHFNLSTNKTWRRDCILNLLLNFLSGKTKNQQGENISQFRCRTRAGQ